MTTCLLHQEAFEAHDVICGGDQRAAPGPVMTLEAESNAQHRERKRRATAFNLNTDDDGNVVSTFSKSADPGITWGRTEDDTNQFMITEIEPGSIAAKQSLRVGMVQFWAAAIWGCVAGLFDVCVWGGGGAPRKKSGVCLPRAANERQWY